MELAALLGTLVGGGREPDREVRNLIRIPKSIRPLPVLFEQYGSDGDLPVAVRLGHGPGGKELLEAHGTAGAGGGVRHDRGRRRGVRRVTLVAGSSSRDRLRSLLLLLLFAEGHHIRKPFPLEPTMVLAGVPPLGRIVLDDADLGQLGELDGLLDGEGQPAVHHLARHIISMGETATTAREVVVGGSGVDGCSAPVGRLRLPFAGGFGQ